ncbi:helix-turn-helix domain-containing protein [Gordonia amarae]|uniref:Helix-turn-helix domain-containing protein n=2 Tax=Gordonia amarae TaxID=36821 RepID=A0A857LTR2_9ACTN|nr:helix-turn-helix domain-containing protein [Gordonia amarae]MCS3878950.1 DNA-binding GntR family transcriptional regulator [Gordonia amarae]QHN17500.1 helix-turn-helix domain-containing protein [Gordonia amarae]QHN22026.1 helix-turn-helix domain-containing protein [Gordonia amarae]QHN30907.1 helix-turn-helix domain-containing protein [Gordonia amarae]QHN39653.1 helix-turn-helix domain-containing protein [Gordonia amarae]
MNDERSALRQADREVLLRTARSRTAPHGLVTRAQIVLDCADSGVAEAARRAGVSTATASKWVRRFAEAGIDGLRDTPRSGRPSAGAADIERILRYALVSPPAGSPRWSTRLIAQDIGISQATVSRVRRRFYPQPEPDSRFVPDASALVLIYVDVDDSGCAVGFHRTDRASSEVAAGAALLDTVETIACASLLRRPHDGYPSAEGSGARESGAAGADRGTPRAVALLRRAASRLPATPPVTLVIDVPLDDAARRWLAQHPGFTVRTLTPTEWLMAVHRIADSVDSRQLTELRAVADEIRRAYGRSGTRFTWSRTDVPDRARDTTAVVRDPVDDDLAQVVSALCTAITEGELGAGSEVMVRTLARRTAMSSGRVAEALARLAAEALLDQSGGKYLVPLPGARDVIETYTARGLLGTAIARRLASSPDPLPASIDDFLERLEVCDRMGLAHEAHMIDLDFQNELAKAAEMPRIGWMFVQLSLQLRLFVTIIGLDYKYPTREIVDDGLLLVSQCRAKDPEAAVAAWRGKVDNCARYMLQYLEVMTGRRQDLPGRSVRARPSGRGSD